MTKYMTVARLRSLGLAWPGDSALPDLTERRVCKIKENALPRHERKARRNMREEMRCTRREEARTAARKNRPARLVANGYVRSAAR